MDKYFSQLVNAMGTAATRITSPKVTLKTKYGEKLVLTYAQNEIVVMLGFDTLGHISGNGEFVGDMPSYVEQALHAANTNSDSIKITGRARKTA